MLLTMNDKPLKRVAVVNDTATNRDEMAESLSEIGLEPIIQTFRLGSIEECIATVTTQAEAAILEHHFKSGHYANFMGAEAVAQLYRQQFPSLLVTAWAEADRDNIHPFRRHIPVLIRSSQVEPETIMGGFEQCLNEFKNSYSTERKPWRTLVRIEEVNRDLEKVYAMVPAWNPRQVVKFPLSLFPINLQPSVEPGARFLSKVNIGATT
jgi:CheY-like chemotaxis protein